MGERENTSRTMGTFIRLEILVPKEVIDDSDFLQMPDKGLLKRGEIESPLKFLPATDPLAGLDFSPPLQPGFRQRFRAADRDDFSVLSGLYQLGRPGIRGGDDWQPTGERLRHH